MASIHERATQHTLETADEAGKGGQMRGFRLSFKNRLSRMLMTLGVAGAFVAGNAASTLAARSSPVRRSTLAITYGEGHSTNVAMVGSSTAGVFITGDANVKRKQGRTHVKLHMESLPHPQALGSFYTTYVLWAVAPEGQAESLAELPHSKSVGIDVTTSFQAFGLIVTAEPHSAVRLPSPLVVAENAAREDTEGVLRTGRMEYGGAVGELYAAVGPDDVPLRDFVTPLPVLGAR